MRSHVKDNSQQLCYGKNKDKCVFVSADGALLVIMFKMICSALQNHGQLAFTIEEQNINDTFTLQDTGRYAHSQQYIKAMADKHRFIIEVDESIVPRIQNEIPIVGLLYILRKSINDLPSN